MRWGRRALSSHYDTAALLRLLREGQPAGTRMFNNWSSCLLNRKRLLLLVSVAFNEKPDAKMHIPATVIDKEVLTLTPDQQKGSYS